MLILDQSISDCLIAFDPNYISKSKKENFLAKYVLVKLCKKSQMGLEICVLLPLKSLVNNPSD